ncbi:MAG TPA: hypothetical protein VFS60_09685 [Thermoanaerobaculia bacterium]|nr:hypothetical protein [Thermoanaerobaculia bacterium]
MQSCPQGRSRLGRTARVWLLILIGAGANARAQEPPDAASGVDALRAEIAALRAEYEQRIAALEQKLVAIAAGQASATAPTAAASSSGAPPTAAEAATASTPSPAEAAAAAADLATATEAAAAAQPAVAAPALEPAPVTIVASAGGKNFLNLSLDGLIAAGASTARDVGSLEPGGHDPAQRGFTVQNVETVFEGAVDPYFRGQANLVLQITPDGETNVELEEAYATSTSLPAGLQLKAGQFFSEFGRLNPSHPHSWDFVDQPLVNGRFFGPDGLRSTGARVSWLVPTSFYSEAFLTLQNSQGETASSFRSAPGETLFGRDIERREVSGLADLLVVPRYALSFDLSDTKTVVLGASAALGPNGTGEDARTRIYGLDGFWKWKPTNAFNGFPFVKVQGEVMRRDASVAAVAEPLLPAESFSDWGSYLQVSWGYRPGHVVGLRLDRVAGDQGDPVDPNLAPRWRLSPALTWFPTEFSKLRLQYNFDRSDLFPQDEHSLWLQLEFLLGAHAAHKF